MVKPSDINIKKSSTNTPVKTHRQKGGADRFLITAKELTVKNYNDHRPEESPEISYDEVYIVWFSKTINNWKAYVRPPIQMVYITRLHTTGIGQRRIATSIRKLERQPTPIRHPQRRLPERKTSD